MTQTLRLSMCAGFLAATIACSQPSVEEVATDAPVPVTVAAAHIGTITSVIAASASVVPAPGADWTITAPEPARIQDLPKSDGDIVHEGDLLVRFEIPTLPADLEAKRAAATQASARVDQAKAALARVSGLLDRGVAAAREVEDARREFTQAEADLTQARSAVEASATLSDRAVVKARFPGVVAKRWHNPGDLVDASATDPILRIIDPARLQLVASVPVAALTRIVPGRAVRVTDPAGDTCEATVLTRPTQVDPASATADVRLAFKKATTLATGTVVQVEIVSEERPHVLLIPSAAIVHDGAETFVMTAGTDGKAHKQAIKTGLATHDLTEITSGLADGDQVVLRAPDGLDGLPDKTKITVAK